jgi:biotin carboxyl carrier protein
MLEAIVNEKNSYAIQHTENGWLLNDNVADLDIQWQPNGLLSVLYNGKSYTAIIEKIDKKAKELTIRVNGQSQRVAIKEPIDQLLSSMGMDAKASKKIEPVKAPMPGMVLKILVEAGQQLNKGDGMLVLEAMKMENILKATGSAIVKSIKVNERTAVEKGAVLIELE